MIEEELEKMDNNELIGIIKAQRYEMERLNNIIKEVREEIEKLSKLYDDNYTITDKAKDILEILDKGE